MAKKRLILAAAAMTGLMLSTFSSVEHKEQGPKGQSVAYAESSFNTPNRVEYPMFAFELKKTLAQDKFAVKKQEVMQEFAEQLGTTPVPPATQKPNIVVTPVAATPAKQPAPTKAVNEVKAASAASSAGEWVEYTATFYNAGVASTGKSKGDAGYGITYSGRPVEDGVTLSVDKRILPVVREGQGDPVWVEVKYPDGHIEKRRVDDTGSAIKGHRVDVFYDRPDSELNDLGVQKVQIRVIKLPQS